MSAPRPEDLVRAFPDRDFLIADGGAGASYVAAMHRAFYRFAAEELAGAERVLDAGCGTGIGTELLAPRVDAAVGVDVKPLVLHYAARCHRAGEPMYGAADATALPFADRSFDAVVADELLEHLPDGRSFLRETVRVLRDGGVFVCATVNARHTFGSADRPANRNHFREYGPGAFRDELERCFDEVVLLGQASGDAYRRFAGSPWARGVERLLMALGVKHRIPADLRMRVRGWLTGSAVSDIVDESQFRVKPTGVEESVYLVAVARGPCRLDGPPERA